MSTVGFIGLGNIGRPMAANLVAAGFDLIGFDLAGTEGRLPATARAAASAAEVFEHADVLLLSVPDGAASSAVVDELAAATGATVSTVIDLSTIGPQVAKACATALAAAGIDYCDGPVSGGVAGARAGTLALMFAGPSELLEQHRPMLAAIAGNVFHVGEQPGEGQTMKLVNNFLSAVALAATSEAFAFGVAEGLELATMAQVVSVSSGRNSATDDKFPRHIVPGTFAAGFHTRLMAKDVALYLECVDAAGTPAEVGSLMETIWSGANSAMPGSDFTEIWKYISGTAAAD